MANINATYRDINGVLISKPLVNEGVVLYRSVQSVMDVNGQFTYFSWIDQTEQDRVIVGRWNNLNGDWLVYEDSNTSNPYFTFANGTYPVIMTLSRDGNRLFIACSGSPDIIRIDKCISNDYSTIAYSHANNKGVYAMAISMLGKLITLRQDNYYTRHDVNTDTLERDVSLTNKFETFEVFGVYKNIQIVPYSDTSILFLLWNNAYNQWDIMSTNGSSVSKLSGTSLHNFFPYPVTIEDPDGITEQEKNRAIHRQRLLGHDLHLDPYGYLWIGYTGWNGIWRTTSIVSEDLVGSNLVVTENRCHMMQTLSNGQPMEAQPPSVAYWLGWTTDKSFCDMAVVSHDIGNGIMVIDVVNTDAGKFLVGENIWINLSYNEFSFSGWYIVTARQQLTTVTRLTFSIPSGGYQWPAGSTGQAHYGTQIVLTVRQTDQTGREVSLGNIDILNNHAPSAAFPFTFTTNVDVFKIGLTATITKPIGSGTFTLPGILSRCLYRHKYSTSGAPNVLYKADGIGKSLHTGTESFETLSSLSIRGNGDVIWSQNTIVGTADEYSDRISLPLSNLWRYYDNTGVVSWVQPTTVEKLLQNTGLPLTRNDITGYNNSSNGPAGQ